MKSSKLQAPTSRETPITEIQTPTLRLWGFRGHQRVGVIQTETTTSAPPHVGGYSSPSWSLRVGAFLVLGAWSLVLLTSGCAVGPNYHRPANAVPAGYK